MGDQLFLDCTTEDIRRLQSKMVRLALAFQAMQKEVSEDLDMRDTLIVTIGSLELCEVAVTRAARQMAGTRFRRSIRKALLLLRKFTPGIGAPNPEASN